MGVVSPSNKILALTVILSPIRVLFLFGVLFGSHVIVASGTGSPFSKVKKSFGDAPLPLGKSCP